MLTKKIGLLAVLIVLMAVLSFTSLDRNAYTNDYKTKMVKLEETLTQLHSFIQKKTHNDTTGIDEAISKARLQLKTVDFWLRYLEPTVYKQLNGPLPVEWETEVFEKYEPPYKREGAGLTLAKLYLEESKPQTEVMQQLISRATLASKIYQNDSITKQLAQPEHFYLCNRLYLLNLATIYTTGFENPNSAQIIPELKYLLHSTKTIYATFNQTYSHLAISSDYLTLYNALLKHIDKQTNDLEQFDHFEFIKSYINPLFAINQQLIRQHGIISRNNIDYALNNSSTSLFDKNLYDAQHTKGIFLRVSDSSALKKIEELGRLLFYDPILSGNNERSCASCHQPTHYFADTSLALAINFTKSGVLERNAPSLINAPYNHLMMQDGLHLTLQAQARAVITNSIEMNGDELTILKKIKSCATYKTAFKELLKFTPTEKEITLEHICSAITYYYGRFSNYTSPFDEAMLGNHAIDNEARQGFNLFMGKAQCATCHFVPQFNGVKPPYIGSEFEVLGTPSDTNYTSLSKDEGRYRVNPATETQHAFRTSTLRNVAKTAPYMHNGVFKTLAQVIDFYDGGGGAGHGLSVSNQTLSSDSLHLTPSEKKALQRFMESLTETIPIAPAPKRLPESRIKLLNTRQVGGRF